MSKPVIVVAPGCWHVPAHFELVQNELDAAGYTCFGVDLPGNNVESTMHGKMPDMDDDITAIRNAVLAQLDKGQDVILVMHSYGSIPGTAAVAGLDSGTRQAAGHSTCVHTVVILTSYLVPPGLSLLAAMGGKLAPQYLHDTKTDTTLPFNGPGATHLLYYDLEPTEVEKAIWRLKPQSLATHTSPTPDQIAALRGMCVSYLVTRNDHVVPPAVQAHMIAEIRASGVTVYAEVAESGHSPFLKLPQETARFIRMAAGEQIKSGFQEFRSEDFSSAPITNVSL